MSTRRGSFKVQRPPGVVAQVKQHSRLAWLKAQQLRRRHWRQLVREWLQQSRRAFKFYTASALLHAVLLALLALIIFRYDRIAGNDEIVAEFVGTGLSDLPLGTAGKGDSLSVEFVDTQLGDPSPEDGDDSISPGVEEFGSKSVDDSRAFSSTVTARAVSTLLESSSRAAVGPDARPARAPRNQDAPAGAKSRGQRRRGEPGAKTGTDAGLERLKSQFDGRSATARSGLLKAFGGNEASEAAVKAGLDWLAAHQHDGGSWNFNHLTEQCDATCTHPGSPMLFDCEIGATGLALLAFLGAGHTHHEGGYQRQVATGLDYLIADLHPGPGGYGIDFRDGSLPTGQMYVHAIATMALSEAYAMTRDPRLREPAQGGVNFIAWSQDPEGGGWRYQPQAPGDTSVVGWQAMALTSARVAGLDVPRATIPNALKFLRSVQAPGDVGYGYMSSNPRPSTTAIGLLCKMYLQPDTTRDLFRRGALTLAGIGPSRDDIYYDYYATQFMHQYGGDTLWKQWNEKMRDWLIVTQEKDGHAAGSWSPGDRHGATGGRVYMTSMAVMTLEVYYRHLPLYQRGIDINFEERATDAVTADGDRDKAKDAAGAQSETGSK
ncbi:MAG: prenyltransferase/squalene oxidase repeat-containing protein [Planctomycetaceae bacterium]